MFWVAIGVGAVIVAVMAFVLLRKFSSWSYALPLVLFENVRPAQALRVSRERIETLN